MNKKQALWKIWRRNEGPGKNTGRGEESNIGGGVFQIQDCGKREPGPVSTVLRAPTTKIEQQPQTTDFRTCCAVGL